MRILLLTLIPGLLVGLGVPAHAKDAPLKPGKVHALKTKTHDRAWSLFVPSKYSKKSSWPLVISSHGRGGSGKGEMGAWQGLANKHGFIVACPDMVTATHNRPKKSNLPASEEDDQVLLEIIDTVSRSFRVNRRAVMVTGFSGGGNPSYHSGLRHPDIFTHICTRGGNWAPQHMPSDEKLQEAGRKLLQIYVFWGERDHVLIIGEPHGTGQAYQALEALKKARYENIRQQEVPAMGHKSRPDLAATWFGDFVTKNKKVFKAGDQVDALLAKAREAQARDKHKDAVKFALKDREAETKHGLRSASKKLIEALDAIGSARLEEAAGLQQAGDLKGALKVAAATKRDFKGLPAGSAAGTLEQLLKALAK